MSGTFHVAKDGSILEFDLAPDKIVEVKALISTKNEELYRLQKIALERSNQGYRPDSPEQLADFELCAALEAEISSLCKQVRRTQHAIKDGSLVTSKGFNEWHSQQVHQATQIETSMRVLQDSDRSDSPLAVSRHVVRSHKRTLAAQAIALEKRAESAVRGLHKSVAKSNTQEFSAWREARITEIKLLEAELQYAREARQTATAAEIEDKLKACHEDLESMEDFMRLEASSPTTDSNYTDLTSTNDCSITIDDSSDDEDEYEDEEIPSHRMKVGDEVQLICDAEDGFKTGEVAVVIEAESPTSASYPYRIGSRRRGSPRNGFFKLTDLKLVKPAEEYPVQK